MEGLFHISAKSQTSSAISEFVEEQQMMHTLIQLKIIHNDRMLVRSVMDEAFRLFRRYESAYNFYDPGSELASLNTHPGEDVSVSREFYDILKSCCTIGEKSGGAYDITIGPVVRLWDFGSRKPRVPSRRKLAALLPCVDFRNIRFKEGSVSITPGTSVDLSGAIKGFAADAAKLLFRERGVINGMVNAGRNMYLLGRNLEGAPWRIGVAHPGKPGSIFAVLHLQDEAVATSGDYERYFIKNGKRYHHLLDPRTGSPSRRCIAVTVVSKSAALTDMLSTAAFILGPEKGGSLLSEMECEGLFVTGKGIEATPGLQSKLEYLCEPKEVVRSILQSE